LTEELIHYFTEDEKAIRDLFAISEKMFSEMMTSGAPKAPYEMNLFEKLSFGINSLFKRPTLLKFMKKRSDDYFLKKFKSQDLATIMMSYYPINDLVLFSQIYGWMMMKKNANYYPKGGMQSLPDTAAAAFKENDGTILLNTEVEEIIIENGRAKGVRCIHGLAFYSDIVIANSPIHHTLSKLLPELPILESFRKRVLSKELFTSVMLIFVGIKEEYDFQDCNFISIMDSDSLHLTPDKINATNCPILSIVLPKPDNQKNNSLLIGAFLPYSYHNYWNTDGTMIRNDDYRNCKQTTANEIIDRITDKLGKSFKDAIDYVLPATPLTLERYTYNKEGSIMGWNLDPKNYGKFIPQTTPINNLFFVGQWVFPGGGVPGVVASGYYLAKKILAKEGIDLEKEFKEYFQNR
jgi:phytoene dehydrogenase-like protein